MQTATNRRQMLCKLHPLSTPGTGCLGRKCRVLPGKPPGFSAARRQLKTSSMLYTFALILIIAWLLGLVSDYTVGGFIHILLVVAIILVLVRVIRREKI